VLAILIARAKEDGHTRKYTSTKWNIIFYLSALGIEVLDIKTKYLLRKWIFDLLNDEGGVRGRS
jgi:hypothetical protein